MKMRVSEVAELVGISSRTLHHYDEIGLLTPKQRTDANYRLYGEEDLKKLQQILFFRELGFSLKRIKGIIESPAFNREEALCLQRQMLLEKRRRLDKMIAAIDKAIKHHRGEIAMTVEERFEGFNFSHDKYEEEARRRWGHAAVESSKAKLKNLTPAEQKAMVEKMNAIYAKLASLLDTSPKSAEAQAAIKEWYDFLNDSTGHHYSLQAFKGLGEMYVADNRFSKNIDQFGEGLAEFMCEAMAVFSETNKE